RKPEMAPASRASSPPTAPPSSGILPLTRSAAGSSTPRSERRFASTHSERDTASAAGSGALATRPVYADTRREDSSAGPASRSNGAGLPAGWSPETPRATVAASDQSIITPMVAGLPRRHASQLGER